MPSRIPTRQDDEQLIDWLARRAAGVSSYKIARDEGIEANKVRTATNRVKTADLAVEFSDGAYW